LHNIICGSLLWEINNTILVSDSILLKISIEMNRISRRRFLQIAGAAVLTAAVAVPAIGGGRNHHGVKRVRVRKLAGQGNPTPAEIAFYQRARFATAADAMRAVASRRMTAEIYVH
jgi:hypothetical protein